MADRRLALRSTALLVCTAVVLATSPGAQPTAQEPNPAGRRFALLVGVTEFSHPSMKKHNLEGPANDVALFRRALLDDTLQFPANHIVSLAGWPANEAERPTRANIERAFRTLRDAVRPSDQVVILLAGHGSQQPADPDPDDEEPDGLDEIFLPADVSGWDGSKGAVTNAIVDDDIRRWVGDIRSRGAVVWIIVDACHSGTLTRAGAGPMRERGIPVDTLIPAEVTAGARARARTTRPRTVQPFDFARDPDITALYAADATETTPELPMPDREGPVHGLFTYTLTRLLLEHSAPLTYRDLMQRVIDRYRTEGFATTPGFEGSGVDREVLGERTIAKPRTFAIERVPGANDDWLVGAGGIQGLTVGSILEVLSPVGSPDAPIGHLRVAEVSPTASLAHPVRFGNTPSPSAAQIAPGSRARVRLHEFGRLRLGVAPQPETTSPSQAGAAAIERALDVLERLSDGLAARAPEADAAWRVGMDRGRVVLSNAVNRFEVGAPDDPRLAERLADQMRRAARVANLARLSSYVDADARLNIDVRRLQIPGGQLMPLLSQDGRPTVSVGQVRQFLQFTVRNAGTVPLDITVLYIDANFGIHPLFPESERALDNRLDPGREHLLQAEINDEALGWESVVAIGVEASPRHENFLTLTQEALPEAVRSSVSLSPIRGLLESAMSATRAAGPTAMAPNPFAITQTWFLVERAAR